MKVHALDDMFKGWFIGAFNPTLYHTDAVEVACKIYKKGESESAHHHKIATEFTLVVSGSIRMNESEFHAGSIVEILPGESVSFEALTDATTVVVKVPGAPNDKYLD